MIRVLITDDHPIVRGGLQAILAEEPDIIVTGEAVDGVEAEEKALTLRPDVIIMDINMPRRDGLETMLSIRQQLPDTKFLFLTVSDQDEILLQAVRQGASGYLLKKSDTQEVVNAIRTVAGGGAAISPEMAARLLDEIRNPAEKPSLSTREEEILKLLGQGLKTSEISAQLYLSEGTISTYIHRILDKLGLKNRGEAIAWAVRHYPGMKKS